ncbi:protein of unknown function (DUF4389) [Gaiella occulta]|uniref:DUF4389 domain-containing protein n=1 Tax=Gaiella occulta TaxID=1002870 RepID=A0A7M2Z171_9ACTN|nr:protein of unknown function (DUF4389) [Gaiella occulta]
MVDDRPGQQNAAVESAGRRPVRLVVADDLRRPRVTVLPRLLLAVPHLLWLALWTLAVLVPAPVLWLAVLARGRAPRAPHRFVAAYVRYSTHVSAYLSLVAGPYPSFTGAAGYPVDIEIDPPARQGRLGAAFRLVLAVPALMLSASLAGAPAIAGGGAALSFATGAGGVLFVVALLGWCAGLAAGRMPRGLRDVGAYAIGYAAQTTAYVLLLSDRYPSADPALVRPPLQLPAHPVRIAAGGTLERSRLTVLFRWLLATPHLLWLALWSTAVVPAAALAWLAALVSGTVPGPLFRFLAAWTRYAAHVSAFVFLVGGPFPGFVGARGSYPVDVEIDGSRRRRRVLVLVRIPAAIPALLMSTALTGTLSVVALLGWWHALVTGRMPEGIRNLGAACIRYNAQTAAYLFLLGERYPYAGPVLRAQPGDEQLSLLEDPGRAPAPSASLGEPA